MRGMTKQTTLKLFISFGITALIVILFLKRAIKQVDKYTLDKLINDFKTNLLNKVVVWDAE